MEKVEEGCLMIMRMTMIIRVELGIKKRGMHI